MSHYLLQCVRDNESMGIIGSSARRDLRSNIFARRVVLLAIIFAAPPAIASQTPATGVLTLVLENDFFYYSDRNYTSGLALSWVPTGEATPDLALRVAHGLPWFSEEAHVRHGYVVGQNIYTPRNLKLANPQFDDRPYAGWLYGTMGMDVETERQLDQFAMTLGVLGPAAHAEPTQKFMHNITGSPPPQGWDSQLGNELGMVFSYQHSWRELAVTNIGGLDLDLTPHIGGALGNVYMFRKMALHIRRQEMKMI